VVYSKSAKAAALRVPRPLINRHTAVSGEVACAMARGAARRFGADLGVAVTGVAGPTRDEDGNPVGLFFVAVCSKSRLGICRHRQLRSKNPSRNLVAMHLLALDMLEEAIAASA
jgi:nicotinamide-nucleotide amidase